MQTPGTEAPPPILRWDNLDFTGIPVHLENTWFNAHLEQSPHDPRKAMHCRECGTIRSLVSILAAGYECRRHRGVLRGGRWTCCDSGQYSVPCAPSLHITETSTISDGHLIIPAEFFAQTRVATDVREAAACVGTRAAAERSLAVGFDAYGLAKYVYPDVVAERMGVPQPPSREDYDMLCYDAFEHHEAVADDEAARYEAANPWQPLYFIPLLQS